MKLNQWCKFLTVTSIIFTVISCGPNGASSGKGNIDVESAVGKGRIVNLSEVATDIRYIPLETTTESVIGNVWNVKYSNGKIYISDNKYAISIFKDDGIFIKKFSRVGRGPEEYINLMSFQVNDTDGGIEILDSSGRIIRYDSDGNFIEVIDKIYSKSRSQTFINMSDFFVSSWYINSRSEDKSETVYGVTAYRDTSDIINEKTLTSYSGMKTQQIDGGVMVFMRIDPPSLVKYKDELRFMMSECDTIFNMDSKGRVSCKYVLNYGKYQAPKEQDFDSYTNNESNFITLATGFKETERYMLFDFNLRALAPEPIERVSKGRDGKESVSKNTNVYAVFDKRKENLTFLNQPEKGKMGFREDIKGGLPFWPRFAGNRGELISFRNAIDIITLSEENPENQFIGNLASIMSENDNPVIIIVTPK